jgi:hypothetical protein
MAARIKIGYFLEDRGHEIFIKAIVKRIAMEKGFLSGEWSDDVRSAIGGKSIQAYRKFLKDITKIKSEFPFNILIVASDGNCKGYIEKRNQLIRYAKNARIAYLDRFVFAIPDPHIEKWYLNDPKGFNRAFGSGILPVLPSYKCKRGLYKKVMRDAIASSEITPLFDGYEYGERIVKEMDIYEAGKSDSSFKHFIEDIGNELQRLRNLFN